MCVSKAPTAVHIPSVGLTLRLLGATKEAPRSSAILMCARNTHRTRSKQFHGRETRVGAVDSFRKRI
jgi:hypothetical protein